MTIPAHKAHREDKTNKANGPKQIIAIKTHSTSRSTYATRHMRQYRRGVERVKVIKGYIPILNEKDQNNFSFVGEKA